MATITVHQTTWKDSGPGGWWPPVERGERVEWCSRYGPDPCVPRREVTRRVRASDARALIELAAGPLPRPNLVERLAAPTRDLPAVAHSTAHQVTERMAERGWVTQTRVPRDGKAGRPTVEVELTDEGRRVLADLPVAAGVA